jgi:pimeloyl-ACP methyl ester carboxylesterase
VLEVIQKGSCSEAHPVPLLFVHGSWHAAWCWNEHFLDFFADKGYHALALSLRNHGNSPTRAPLTCSIADYVSDVASVAESLPTRPVLVGHSMGGFLVQKYLETRRAPAGVLLAPTPPSGASRGMFRILRRHPLLAARALLTGKSRWTLSAQHVVRENFFSTLTPDSDVARYTAMLDEEYFGRQMFDLTLFGRPKPQRVTTPLLVLAAERDAIFARDEQLSTARAYGAELEVFPGMGHDMMLEPGWRAVAERIHTWLVTRHLAGGR